MKPEKSRYWLFQLLGWGIFAFINVFFAIVFNQHVSAKIIYRLVFFIEMGILFSHLMREVIRKKDVLSKSLQQQIVIFTGLTLLFAFAIAAVQTPFEEICGLRSVSSSKSQFANVFFFNNFAPAVPLLFMWNSVYFMYHYVRKSRRQQMETLQLAALVKALELKTIKSHINPHFIFNSLNSIRALVDENPKRARRAITELSNILRSSMQAEKSETVPLEKELDIVKDYLALEQMRFEERLKIEYDIDEDTLQQPVPPMMLQTLVENAIKHGISKQLGRCGTYYF